MRTSTQSRYTITKGGKAQTSPKNMTTPTEPAELHLQSINKSFKFYDFNSDGVISRAELQRYWSDSVVDGIIDRLDKNKDGVISYSEFYSELSKIKDGEATLQRYLEKFPLATPGVEIGPDMPVKYLDLQGNKIPMTWAPALELPVIEKIFKYGPFCDWMASISKIQNPDPTKPELAVDKVHIQQIDLFGPKIGFLKFEVAARKWNEKMNQIAYVPGIVFMRGGAVGILCVLIDLETREEFALITLQPRIPAGYSALAEIPAGMLDGEPGDQKFAGRAAKEMSEEAFLEIKEHELFDLTRLAYGDNFHGMYPSAGGCDEFLKLFLYRREMSKETMDLLREANTGEGPSEIIKLKLVPLDNLWKEAPDAKALGALYLYERFQKEKVHHPPTPYNAAQEEQIRRLIKPKIATKRAWGQRFNEKK